jgi:type IV secretion system protein VirB10
MSALQEGEGPREPAAKAAPTEPVMVDRTISPVAGGVSAGLAGRAVTVAAVALGGAVMLFADWRHPAPRPKAPLDVAAQIVPFEPAKPAPPPRPAGPQPGARASAPTLADPGVGAPSLSAQSSLSAAGAAGAGQAPGAPQPLTPAQAAAEARAARLSAIRAAPILAFSQAGAGARAAAEAALPEGLGGAQLKIAAGAAPTPGELDQLRTGSAIRLVHAGRLSERNFLITAGAPIACILMTAMDTSAPGYVSCLIGQDVFSDNGAVVLLEKGSKVLGEYRSGLRQGQGRLFVLWDRVITPGGAAINLASPASDALGRAGFGGRLDTHFWSRFGAALMFSIVDDASTAITPHAGGAGSLVRLPSETAAIALGGASSIAPTLIKPQGAEVSIFVANDLDFSSVYRLQAP